jgi:pimeloyl-ACP methyl ester carboxylesterase
VSAGVTRRRLTLPDGRTLEYIEAGTPGGPLLLAHHGTPGSARFHLTELDGAERAGARLVAYSRPGYAGSSPQPGRSVADAAADVAALLDALGTERFATYGVSGGGPHALACAALLPERCAAAATVAGVGPADAPDLDFLAGMGAGNVEEFGIADKGREPLAEFLGAQAEGLSRTTPEQLGEAAGPHLSDVDAAALTGALAEHMHATILDGLAPGIDGWLDDDLAFVEGWGFDVRTIAVPVAVWQGEQDLMVPGAHGRWLCTHVRGAEAHLPEQEGHLTLFANRIGEIQSWLAERL